MRHGDERPAGVVADFVDRRDVWMIERTSGPRLSQQAGRGFWTARRLRVEKLERHSALEGRVLREIDRAHPAGTNVADDPVMGDAGADHPRDLTLVNCPLSCLNSLRRSSSLLADADRWSSPTFPVVGGEFLIVRSSTPKQLALR